MACQDQERLAQSPLILLVDDDPDYALLVREALEDGGRFTVTVAATASEARERGYGRFSTVVLDHNLPDATGLDLLPEIAASCEVPVIMLTGENVVETAVRSIQSGAFGYLLKTPENLDVLPEVVGQATAEAQRRRERHEMRAQVERAESLASLGSLSMGMCHEMNNPLAAIMGTIELHRQGIENDVDCCMDEIWTASCRLRDVVMALASFASGTEPPRERVDLAAVAREELAQQKTQFKAEGVATSLDLPSDPLEVIGSGPGLQQVLHHMLRNARQAVEHSQEKVVAVRVCSSGALARLEVEDTGHGVPEEIRSRVFDPFFTTRDPNQGMGMGLAISHRIVDQHGGQMRCETGASRGALFTVEVPLRVAAENLEAAGQGGPDV